MTDREKIRAEIERLINNHDSALDYEAALEDVRKFIDSLQEPKFKTGDHIRPIDSCIGSPRTIVDVCDGWYVTDQGTLDFEYEDNWEAVEESVSVWHNMDEVPIKGEVIVVQTKDTFYGLSIQKGGTTYKNKNKDRYIKWAYASDLLNLSNVERTVKDWKEEPVSEEWIEELKTKLDSMSKEDFKKVFDKYTIDFDEEHVSEDLEEAGKQYLERSNPDRVHQITNAFKAGAKWQKHHLWKPADGDDLPVIDREVIALLDNGKVVFAHRPPEYWDGKNIETDKVTRYYPKTHDKGGWNIPNVKWWLDCSMPKEIEL